MCALPSTAHLSCSARRLGSADCGGVSRGQVEHREDVRLVAVHAAGREQAHDVKRPAGLARRGAGRAQLGVGEETAVLDRGVDPGQVLVDDPAGAQIHVPDLGIAHLPVRQADVAALGVDQRMRPLRPQPAPVRQLGQRQGVVGRVLAMPPTVQDHEHDGLGAGGSGHVTFGAVTSDRCDCSEAVAC
jgi:hypothetical protein